MLRRVFVPVVLLVTFFFGLACFADSADEEASREVSRITGWRGAGWAVHHPPEPYTYHYFTKDSVYVEVAAIQPFLAELKKKEESPNIYRSAASAALGKVSPHCYYRS